MTISGATTEAGSVSLGVRYPHGLMRSGDHGELRAFLEGVEAMGYGFVSVGDHVVGADTSVRPDWKPYFGTAPLYDLHSVRHEPFVMFGLFTGMTSRLEMTTGILISPQRQTVLLAKQAAHLDWLSGGRIRLVIAAGWNDVEYDCLGIDFTQRGGILDEQFELLRLLFTQPVVNYEGEHHTVIGAGLNPLPVRRPIPLWIGGASPPVLRRAGRLADGWFPSYSYFNEDEIRRALATIRSHAAAAGRDPASIGIQGMNFFRDERFERQSGDELPPSTAEECAAYAHRWKELGATHFFLRDVPWASGPGVDEQLAALEAFRTAVGPDL